MIMARREDVLKDAAQKLSAESEGNEVLYQRLDLGDRATIKESAREALGVLGGVDIFIGNAAQDCLEPLDRITEETVDHAMQVNFTSNVSLVKAFLPGMRAKRWGRIIFSSSAASLAAGPHIGLATYSATKAAINAYTRVAAAEAGCDGITVNSLILGMFLTDMAKQVAEMKESEEAAAGKAFIDQFVSSSALRRLGECEEVEGVVQLLASDAGSFITGACLAVDGGLSAMLLPFLPG
jgi:NAD(P)-dependent dehydrogenase (short-subunit alcohol dehydrogenase family)